MSMLRALLYLTISQMNILSQIIELTETKVFRPAFVISKCVVIRAVVFNLTGIFFFRFRA